MDILEEEDEVLIYYYAKSEMGQSRKRERDKPTLTKLDPPGRNRTRRSTSCKHAQALCTVRHEVDPRALAVLAGTTER